ncbi:hypothetical protein [Variovorax sp. ZT4R33]|uniref:hypothetical protein n=1 Tax=Variovorax sp. ZT4R33 TaxID=3443743 RepID=UPI003F47FE8B
MQVRGDNNGALLCSRAHMKPLGWSSNDTLTRAKNELIDHGLLYETVKGHRPNRASWYAVTWKPLERLRGFDEGAALLFRRSAYKWWRPKKRDP